MDAQCDKLDSVRGTTLTMLTTLDGQFITPSVRRSLQHDAPLLRLGPRWTLSVINWTVEARSLSPTAAVLQSSTSSAQPGGESRTTVAVSARYTGKASLQFSSFYLCMAPQWAKGCSGRRAVIHHQTPDGASYVAGQYSV